VSKDIVQKVLHVEVHLRELIPMPRLARVDTPGSLHNVNSAGHQFSMLLSDAVTGQRPIFNERVIPVHIFNRDAVYVSLALTKAAPLLEIDSLFGTSG